MQTNTSLIKDYIPFDFNNTNKNILKKYPILRKWQEDKHFSFFIESIKEEYSIFLFRTDCYIPEEFEDSSKARIYLIPNSLLYSLEKISKALATNKDLECLSFSFNEIENRRILFYSLRYDTQTKDIFLLSLIHI